VLRKVDPSYPILALQRRREGRIWVKVFISKDGEVRRASVIRCDDSLFTNAALSSAMRWQFEPARLGTRSVEVWIALVFRFRLVEGKPSVRSSMAG
jgi:TonB family protein